MKLREYAVGSAQGILARAVISLIVNLLFAFYNGILGFLQSSSIFVVSAVYYLLLSGMRFVAVTLGRKQTAKREGQLAAVVGGMLMVLSLVFQAMVIISMKDNTAAVYGTIPMITIATFTFFKIAAAVISGLRHRKNSSRLFWAVNGIRYAEVAVSLLTMQQSMLVSFEGADANTQAILNACTGAGVCFFILALGLITIKISRKEYA